MTYTPIDRCRGCGETMLFPVIDLGEQPLANAFRSSNDGGVESRYPLRVVACPACTLVQLAGTVDPQVMFDDYAYFSSYSTTMVAAMGRLAQRLVASEGLGPDSLVLEVASNDGYLLKHYLELNIPVLGIEPAKNIAEVARGRGIPTWSEYFDPDLAERIVSERGWADVIHANNVMAHVPDLVGFLEAIRIVLSPQGVAVIETPHVVRMIAGTEFDTIYHEHVFYYSVTAVERAARRCGLVVRDVEQMDVHGGSVRLFLGPEGSRQTHRLEAMLSDEKASGVDRPSYYENFATQVECLREDTLGLLRRLHADGAKIAAYGAAAKGTVLLNHFGIDTDLVDFVVDRNEYKQGKLMPGVGIPIDDPARLLRDRPDYVLLLAWNLRDEVLAQQKAFLQQGGQFVVPVPRLDVVP